MWGVSRYFTRGPPWPNGRSSKYFRAGFYFMTHKGLIHLWPCGAMDILMAGPLGQLVLTGLVFTRMSSDLSMFDVISTMEVSWNKSYSTSLIVFPLWEWIRWITANFKIKLWIDIAFSEVHWNTGGPLWNSGPGLSGFWRTRVAIVEKAWNFTVYRCPSHRFCSLNISGWEFTQRSQDWVEQR